MYEKELVGTIRLSAIDADRKSCELEYFVGAPLWSKGIATDAAQQIIKIAFEEMGFCVLYARCLESNPASARVLEKTASENAAKSWMMKNPATSLQG